MTDRSSTILLEPGLENQSKLASVKLAVKSLQHELATCQNLLDLTAQSLKKFQSDNEALRKLNRSLTVTVKQQNALLVGCGLAPLAPTDIGPVVDPLSTMETLSGLRKRVAELMDRCEEYEYENEVRRKDVLVSIQGHSTGAAIRLPQYCPPSSLVLQCAFLHSRAPSSIVW